MRTRRWLAGIIDVLLVLVLMMIAWVHIDYPHTSYFGFFFAFISYILFLLLTSASIIITNGTAGDRIMSIRCVREDNTTLSWLLFRNLLQGLLIYLPHMAGNGQGDLVSYIVAITLLYPSVKDKAIVRSRLDKLLKTRYIEYSYGREKFVPAKITE
jgi:hypothetical protein